ncbi:hypothetical protein AKJ49_00980 [candidate division MSBL1 archaeon SCGC-AAA382A03]|uniref:histidine kinase n=1 Tax=candidate division MSBL1 archaeon SCGC-AAA382A03 TaxID=1698278 RepID=A0A133VFZ5_9EURY|nr:hypothetical protein AKJ49_00980 [candidate division MSBL1 archaeon SCGC-AAA382A03]
MAVERRSERTYLLPPYSRKDQKVDKRGKGPGGRQGLAHRILEMEKGAETYLEKADDAVADSVEMIKKVETFLEIGRGEVGEVSVNSAIDTAVNRNKTQASERRIQAKFERPDCTVQGGKLLEELFSNLVENAVRHSGCDRVRISGREENDGCVVTVEDDGKGVPDGVKDKIFDRGFKKGKTAGLFSFWWKGS